jgi:hypothetical protein
VRTIKRGRGLRQSSGLAVCIVVASTVAGLAATVTALAGQPRAVSSTDETAPLSVGSAPSLSLQPQVLMNETEDACTDLAGGNVRTVLEGVLGVVHTSPPALARVGNRISLTCEYSADTTRGLRHVRVTTVSGRLLQPRFVRLVTAGVTPTPSRINHPLSTLVWEWDRLHPGGGVLSMLHDGRVVIVQVALPGAKEGELKAHALDLAGSLDPDAL